MKLNVDHLVIATQTIEVPDACAHCGADLRAPAALKHHEYQDQSRLATYRDDGPAWLDDLPESGEGYLAIEWTCRACGRPVCGSREVRVERDDARPVAAILGAGS